MIAEKWDASRLDMEKFAFESHRRAIRAIDEGRFRNEIAPLASVENDEVRVATLRWRRWRTEVAAEGGGFVRCRLECSDASAALLIVSEKV